MKFGILYIPDYYPERYASASHYYGEMMEQIQYEEELGFDGVFFAEHYVGGMRFLHPQFLPLPLRSVPSVSAWESV